MSSNGPTGIFAVVGTMIRRVDHLRKDAREQVRRTGLRSSVLGPDAQRRLMLPHFAESKLAVLQGVGHLSPLECPGELANLIRSYLRTLDAAR